ncbi:MAG: septum site-determining protein MinD [Clostridia bacterium]|nr:septum site-determining protein MinD [Clostridia bacterium]
MGRRIVVTSGKGGAGKTTIAAGLGLSLASLGASVVMIDADVGLSNLDTLLELDGKIMFDLSDLMNRKCRIKQALIAVSGHDNVYVLASGKAGADAEIGDPVRFAEITSKLAEVFDYCIIDCPAGASDGFKTAISGADEAIVVVTPHIVSIRDADKILGILLAAGMQDTMFVINRIRGDLAVSGKMLSHKEIEAVLNAKLVGVVPESDDVTILSSLAFGKIMQREISRSFVMMAESIHKNKRILFDYKKKYRGVFGFIRRKMLEKGA